MDLLLRACRDGFLNEHSNAGEILEYLHLDIAARFQGPTEHGGTSDNDGAGPVLGCHVLDKVIESLEDTGILVRRHDEGVAFFLKNGSRTFDGGINKGYDL